MDALHKLEHEAIQCVCVRNLAYNLKTHELHSLQKGFKTTCYVFSRLAGGEKS